MGENAEVGSKFTVYHAKYVASEKEGKRRVKSRTTTEEAPK
jgi:hypothetical protein